MKNIKINFKFGVVISITLLLLIATAVPVSAQQVALSISPPIVEAVMKPGKSIMVAYTIKNSGDPVVLTERVANFVPKDEFGNIKIESGLSGPVRFDLDNADLKYGQPFFLKTGAVQQLLLQIRVPEGAPEGDYYYSLLVTSKTGDTKEGVSGSQATATIGSNILVTVTGSGIIEVKPRIILFDLLTKLRFNLFGKNTAVFDSFDKVPVVLKMENRGLNLFKPQGKITLRGNFGETADYEIIPKNILAQSERLLEATPSAEPALPHVTTVLSGFFVGGYRLSTAVTFGENSPTVYGTTSFIALPFKIIFGLILSVTIIYIYRKRKKSADRDDE